MPTFEDATWFVSVYVGIIILQGAVHIISFGSGIFRFFQSSPWHRFQSALKSLQQKCRPALSDIPDPAALYKAKRIEAALVKHGTKTFCILSCLLTVFTVRLVRGAIDTRDSMDLCQKLSFLAAFSFSTVVVVRPTVLRAETLPYVYIFTMLCVLTYGAFSGDCTSFFIRSRHVHLMNIFLGFLWMHFPLIMVMNVLGVTLQTIMYARLISSDAPCNDVFWDFSSFIFSQIFVLVNILVISWVTCQHTELAVEWEIDKRSDKCFRIGFLSLLKSMCDATVVLDSTASLVEDSPALAHMILQRAGTSLRGSKLDRWFKSATELATFKELIRNPILEGGQPHTTAFHCDLRSDLDVRIPVQMHIVHFLQTDGTVHHLLGIKEDPEFEALHPLPGIIGRSSEDSHQEFEFRPVNDFRLIDANAEYYAMCNTSPLGCSAFDAKPFANHLAEWITTQSKNVFEKEPEPWSKDLQMKVSQVSSKIIAKLRTIPEHADSVALEVLSDLDVVDINFLPPRRSRSKYTISIYLQLRVSKVKL